MGLVFTQLKEQIQSHPYKLIIIWLAPSKHTKYTEFIKIDSKKAADDVLFCPSLGSHLVHVDLILQVGDIIRRFIFYFFKSQENLTKQIMFM